MSILLYILSYFLADDDEPSVVGMDMPRFHEYYYDYRVFLSKPTICWDDNCRVVSTDDLNLFDESTTPPIQMYSGSIKSILKHKKTTHTY